MLASRCAMAAVIILSLSWYVAVRPFGVGATSTASHDEANELGETIDIIRDSLELEEAEDIHAPEGETTFVIRRDSEGNPVFSIAQPDGTTATSDDLEGLRQQLEKARDEAVNALQELESARSALEVAQVEQQQVQLQSEQLERIAAAEENVRRAGETAEGNFDAGRIEALLEAEEENQLLTADERAPREPSITEPTGPQKEPRLPEDAPWQDPGAVPSPSIVPDADDPTKLGDLSGKLLIGRDFSGQDLRGVDFRRSVLTGAIFDGANLRDADFRGAKLQAARFDGAIMIDADLSGVTAQGAYFKDADLRRSNLENANFTGTNLTGADLRGANTRKTILTGAVRDSARFGNDPQLPLRTGSTYEGPPDP